LEEEEVGSEVEEPVVLMEEQEEGVAWERGTCEADERTRKEGGGRVSKDRC